MEGEEQLGRVIAPGEGEPVEDCGQPGIEVVGQSAPVFSNELGRLEIGRPWWDGSGRGLAVGRRCGEWCGGGVVRVEDVHGNLSDVAEHGVVIDEEFRVFHGLEV